MPRTDSSEILALHGNHGRISPKVPGLNAEPLQPSIGTDHWRTRSTQKRVRNAQIRSAVPVAGRGKPELVTSRSNAPKGDTSGGKANRSKKAPKRNLKRAYSPYGAISLSSGYTL